jgi:hypothetical protein
MHKETQLELIAVAIVAMLAGCGALLVVLCSEPATNQTPATARTTHVAAADSPSPRVAVDRTEVETASAAPEVAHPEDTLPPLPKLLPPALDPPDPAVVDGDPSRSPTGGPAGPCGSTGTATDRTASPRRPIVSAAATLLTQVAPRRSPAQFSLSILASHRLPGTTPRSRQSRRVAQDSVGRGVPLYWATRRTCSPPAPAPLCSCEPRPTA